ncbi:PilX N-terminal domain-containing pilus assembly protein [Steroidobacter sp.]|uniref:pilus assembly PilX family protein n=1 Tax=Steroidobacter sp. TaxID=1978227 RepID=UPI001A4E3BA6|nr:PilX N-terminal domain-containing pilus assembly protein [Steroidobacter sp.]MBL8265211.1 pilus assembly protein [Steroidobacter sp.]
MRASSHSQQRGVALVVSLILLVLATLIGLASVRGTNLQERMSANMYDRSLAFQRAESALRAAEDAITANWRIADLRGVDCSAAGVPCKVIPENSFSGTDGNWVAVDDLHNVNSSKSDGRPEYLIQFMGTGRAENNLGLDANADYGNYGTPYPPDNVAFYRITARSSAPADAVDRSMVVLQSTVKRAI